MCLALLMVGAIIAWPARGLAEEKRVTVTFGNPGDRWLDTMKFIRVGRAQRDRVFGYEVTFQAQGLEDFTWFWSRADIDFDGSKPAYQQMSMKLDTGHLYYPDRITSRSLPDVHKALLTVEVDYIKQARGGMAVGEAFAAVAALGAAVPARGAGLASRSSTSTARGASAKPLPAKPVPTRAAPAKPAPAKPAPAKPAAAESITTPAGGVTNAAGAGGEASTVLLRTGKQLQAKFKHAKDFGIVENYSKANAAEFSRAIHQHINSPGVRAIQGTYHKQPVTHYLDPSSGLNVIADSAGNFISGWKLSPAQLQNVLTHGGL